MDMIKYNQKIRRGKTMKKIGIYTALSILILMAILLYPRKIVHAVFIESSSTNSIMFIKGKSKEVKIPNLNLKKYTVIDFKYNILGVFGVDVISPINNRIMIKDKSSYEIEAVGRKELSSSLNFYKINENETITPASSRDVILGKTNVVSFINKGRLKTFLIYPIDYSNTRVGISTTDFQSVYHNDLQISVNSSSNIVSLINKFSYEINKNEVLRAKMEKGKLTISIGSFKKTFDERVYIKGGPFTINNITRGYPNFNPTYSGVLELYPTSDGLILINEIALEDYLMKVVPSEMPSFGGVEALKCQAIAARTYAISDMLGNKYANLGFYVDDSTKSQVYNNMKPLNITNEAIIATKGIIMTYDNKPIDAKYYSTSSGTGVNYTDIWFNSDGTSDYKPYLKTSNYLQNNTPLPSSEEDWLQFYKNTTIESFDNKSSYYRWQLSYNKETLEENLIINLNKLYKSSPDYIVVYNNTKYRKKLKKLPKELSNLKDIKVVNRSDGGNLLEVSFEFDKVTVHVIKDSNIRRVFSNSSNEVEAYILQHTGKRLEKWTTLPSSFFSVERANDIFTIYGGGFGHGVGMSQYGAMYLSQNKMDYKSILNIYYKDIKFHNIY